MVYNAMDAISAFGAGRQFGTEQRVGNALSRGDMQGAQQAAFRGGDIRTGMALQQQTAEAARMAREARANMDEQQAAAAAENAQRLGGIATGILSSVPDDQIDAYTRDTLQRMGLKDIALPDRPIQRADLEVFAAQAEAMAGELTAARDRNQVTLGANDTLVRREGGGFGQTVGQAGAEVRRETERSNRASEAIDQGQLRLDRQEFEAGQRGGGIEDATALRDRAEDAIGDFRQIEESYQRIIDSVTEPSAAGDLALIFNYMKMLDPGSTVREGEFATAQNAAGVPSRIVAVYNSIRDGQRLEEGQRRDFFSRAERLYQGQRTLTEERIEPYREEAEARQLPLQYAVPRLSNFAERTANINFGAAAKPRTTTDPDTGETVIILDE